MSASLPQRLLAHLPGGRRIGATVAALALASTAALVIAPSAAHGATTPVTVTVAGSSFYGGAPAFGATTNVSGVTVTGVTCTTSTTNATFSASLAAGNYTIKAASCSGGTLSDPNYSIGSYSGSFYIVYKVGITVTADNKSRAYGVANPAFTYAATGGVNGDTSAALLAGAPTISTTATSTSDVGSYPITIAQGTLRSSSPNYYFAAFTAGTLTVGATPLTVTVAGSSFYGSAPGFGATTNVSGVTVTGVTCTATTTSATISSTLNAGSYTIDATTCSGGTLSNPDYSIGNYKASFYLVYKDPITVTADDKSRAYGAANPAFTYQLSGFVNGEDASVVTGKPSITTTATSTSDTGTYPITPALNTLKATNYYFAFTPGTLTVGAAAVTVTVAGVSYYGSAPSFGASTPVSGLTVTGVTCTTATNASTFSSTLNAGSYTIDGTTCSGGVLSNPDYTIAGYSGSFYLVYKVGLTVTADDQARTYGVANPAFTYQVTGFVNGDTASVLSGAASLTTTATKTSDIGSYPITPALGTLKATNYYVATFTPGTLTINASPVTVTVAGAQFYGGTPGFGASTPLSGLTVTGVTCTATTTAAAFSATLPAGNYTIDGTTCSGGVLSSSDFTITGYSGSFYLVYKAPLTVTAIDMNRAYGHANPAFGYQVTGFVNGEGTSAISGTPSITTTATSSSDAGTYPITPTAGSLAAANYYFTFAPGTLTVNPAQVSVTVAGAENYGSAPGFGGTTTVSGLTVTGITCTATTSALPITAALNAGNYTIDGSTCSGGVLSSTNYAIRGYAGSFYLVYKDLLTVTPTSTSRTYGATNPTFAYQVTGFVNGEDASVVSGAPDLSSTATVTSNVGTYPISAGPGTLAATNYYFAVVTTSTLTVAPATLLITASDVSRAYGAPNPMQFSVTGFRNSDTGSVISGAPVMTSTATATSDPGTYVITPTQGTLAAQNYTFAFAPGHLTITKATPVFVTTGALTQPMTDTVTYGTGANSTALVGVTINFYLGKTTTLECSAVTNSSGLASCKAPNLQGAAVLLQGYTAEFDGNTDFTGQSLYTGPL